MTIYVPTQTEGKATIPVGTITSETLAKAWYLGKTGNDFFPLELDQVEHLGLVNGPSFVKNPAPPPVQRFVMPTVPVISPTMTPAKASAALADYLAKLAGSMALIQTALDA